MEERRSLPTGPTPPKLRQTPPQLKQPPPPLRQTPPQLRQPPPPLRPNKPDTEFSSLNDGFWLVKLIFSVILTIREHVKNCQNSVSIFNDSGGRIFHILGQV